MEALSLRHIIFAARGSIPIRWHLASTSLDGHPRISHKRRVSTRVGNSRIIASSRQPDYQDFQGFARPLRLLPSMEANICTESSLVEICNSHQLDESQSLYMVKLRTSASYGSSLSDLSAGILLCLIDENGDAILQRIPVCPVEDPQGNTEASGPDMCFQRGSLDEFLFKGPKLGKIDALWVSLESGCWRLGDASLTTVNQCQTLPEEDGKATRYIGLQYNFEAEDILLGEGGDMSMAELRPHLVAELSDLDLLTLINTDNQAISISKRIMSNEESMREYADLKFSLLLYDAMLIFAGTSIASISAGDKAALAFLTGGLGGFFYLLLLQRSVDGLPAPASISVNRGDIGKLFRESLYWHRRLPSSVKFNVVKLS
uniref:DUF7755 domain-containing protein n=1 Tax=Nelumbo nucifera TaxID=4432 RepID=A0A822YGI7_NELNU|nr:TPA_asm: hypothetical protein HUJ06_031572 [Nelumbo nucifera]